MIVRIHPFVLLLLVLTCLSIGTFLCGGGSSIGHSTSAFSSPSSSLAKKGGRSTAVKAKVAEMRKVPDPSLPPAFCRSARDRAPVSTLPVQDYNVASKWDAPDTPSHFQPPTKCFWTDMRNADKFPQLYDEAAGLKTHMCTADPAIDPLHSRGMHESHHWYGKGIESKLFIKRSPCTRNRPLFVDVGTNIGQHTMISLRYGCKTVSFEPMRDNAARAWSSIVKNGFNEGDAVLFNVAAGAVPDAFLAGYNAGSPGTSQLLRQLSPEDLEVINRSPSDRNAFLRAEEKRGNGVAPNSLDAVIVVTLDDMFNPQNGPAQSVLLQHPSEPRKMRPSDVAVLKIDAEGYDLAVLQGARQFLIEGRVPVIFVELGPSVAINGAGCSPVDAFRFLYSLGYFYCTEFGTPFPLDYIIAVMQLPPSEAREMGLFPNHLFETSEFFFERNDTIGLEARGGIPLLPFMDNLPYEKLETALRERGKTMNFETPW